MVKTKVRNTQNYLYGKWINAISKRPSKGKVNHLSKRYDAHQETPGMQILKAYFFCYLLPPTELPQNFVD